MSLILVSVEETEDEDKVAVEEEVVIVSALLVSTAISDVESSSHLFNSFNIVWIAKQVRSCARAVDFSSGTKWSSRMLIPMDSTDSSQGGAVSGFWSPFLSDLLFFVELF